jgi:hypothetical protein
MPRTPKKDYEPVSREKWTDFTFREFDSDDPIKNRESKRDVHRAVLKLSAKACLGVAFRREFQNRRDELARRGKSLTGAYRMAIGEFAHCIPTQKELAEGGAYTKYNQMALASTRYEEDREMEKAVPVTLAWLHKRLAGKTSSTSDMDWVAENLNSSTQIVELDLADIPSRTALNMLESAIDDKPKFWEAYNRELARRAAAQRSPLTDSNRDQALVLEEIVGAHERFKAECFVQDAAVGT